MNRLLNQNDETFFPYTQHKRHFWKYLLLIGLWYLRPSLSFAYNREDIQRNMPHDQLCYFNFKCAHHLGNIYAFNNVISNIFYIIFGLIFMLVIKYHHQGIDDYKGIHKDPSLYYCLGVVLVFEGISSAIYHICPSLAVFPIDSDFMFVMAVIFFLTIYDKRHKDHIPTPFKTYWFLGSIGILNTIALSGAIEGNRALEGIFWGLTYLMIVYVLVIGLINIYFGVDWSFNLQLPKRIYRAMKEMDSHSIPKLVLVGLVGGYTLFSIIYNQVTAKSTFTLWLLSILIMNLGVYFVYYIIQKIRHGETVRWYVWVGILVMNVSLTFALIFFLNSVSNKSLTPEASAKLNKPCALFDYWDYHDIWHILSAVGLFSAMMIFYHLDDDLNDVERNQIAVF
jgi:hypothetical protein